MKIVLMFFLFSISLFGADFITLK
ncbi:hypothetical protein CP502_01810, partial [Campylobacter sp. BCW_8712]